ncbi:hypothetical protein TSAR_000651 [Trichomalopsis sarcophagae]|uniref:Uncharacterized protein n=1 Tax=Trichomalopsis sarcophagae TaxID=543379 RepID=A0A232F691_9HYME|nr:hypothetical protein TSAR_000651 [Trichomalopsis sarcophagae]
MRRIFTTVKKLEKNQIFLKSIDAVS